MQDISESVSVPAQRKFDERACADCGTPFLPTTGTNYHCPPCQRARTRKLHDEAQARRDNGTNRLFCVDCGLELPATRGRPALRCEPCRVIYRKEFNRKRNKARTESGKRKAYDERYREDSRETIQANGRKYKKAHPETDAAANVRRRHRLNALMTPEDRRLSALFRKASLRWPCFYCGAPALADGPHELEHYFPISKFGTDHFWNLLRSCFACNRGPGGKHQMCGTAFLLKTLPLGAPWPVPPRPEGFPPLPATGPLFRLMDSAAEAEHHDGALLF